MLNVGQELLNVPFARMLTSIGLAIAESQAALDNESMDILIKMADQKNYPVYLPNVNEKGEMNKTPIEVSMLAAGFQPTFYQFSETMIEVKMDISLSGQATESTWRNSRSIIRTDNRSYLLRATPVNATYTNRYNYTIEGVSILKTRLVPIPPNTIIQDFIETTYEKLKKTDF